MPIHDLWCCILFKTRHWKHPAQEKEAQTFHYLIDTGLSAKFS